MGIYTPVLGSFNALSDGYIINTLCSVESAVIRIPAWGILPACQHNRRDHFERISINRHHGVVAEIHPKFVRSWIEECFSRISTYLGFVDHLPGLHIDDDNLFIVFRGEKQMLFFQIVGEVIHIAFGGYRDRLPQPHEARHVLHGRLTVHVLIRLLLRTQLRNEDRAES